MSAEAGVQSLIANSALVLKGIILICIVNLIVLGLTKACQMEVMPMISNAIKTTVKVTLETFRSFSTSVVARLALLT